MEIARYEREINGQREDGIPEILVERVHKYLENGMSGPGNI